MRSLVRLTVLGGIAFMVTGCSKPVVIFGGLFEKQPYMEKYEHLDPRFDPVKNVDGNIDECYIVPNGNVKELHEAIGAAAQAKGVQLRQIQTTNSEVLTLGWEDSGKEKNINFEQVSFDKTTSCYNFRSHKIFNHMIDMPAGAKPVNLYGTQNDGSAVLPADLISSEAYSVPEADVKTVQDQLVAGLTAEGWRDISASTDSPPHADWSAKFNQTEGGPEVTVAAYPNEGGSHVMALDIASGR